MTPRTILAANWKMNLGPKAARELAAKMGSLSVGLTQSDIWLAPCFPVLSDVISALKGVRVRVGAQNVYWEDSGAFTGEVSLPILKEVGCSFVIVGHSERRKLFGETPVTAALRAFHALKNGMTTIFCIGETRDDRDRGKTDEILELQLLPLLEKMEAASSGLDSLVIAYEPVWAIGTGLAATPKEIEAALSQIRSKVSALSKTSPPILYGGSVTPENFGEILGIKECSGALVGGASLSAEKFEAMAKIAETVRR